MGNYIVRILLLLFLIPSFASFAAEDNKIDKDKMSLRGRVKEALTRKDLVKSKVYLSDSAGVLIDSLTTGGYYYFESSGSYTESAEFSFTVPRRPAVYNIEVSMPGYQSLFQTITIDNIGRREYTRTLDPFYLEREPKKLDGVTVTASKIKFYNRGDTVVYNADAFELAEGSMLDALIKQLPGVELREGGQIYVNGEFVENLLLNGKDFFNGKNELMLDNLAAYTVKDVEVYKRESDIDKWKGTGGQKNLVMDVKLKKEYNQGWMINLEAGGGTEDRYMFRAFANRFTNNSRITLVGNVNNLNDNRKPGEATTWTPQSNTTGTMRTQMGGLDYMSQHPEELWKVSGDVTVRHTSQDDERYTDRINFLPSSRTYEHSFANNRHSSTNVSTSHRLVLKDTRYYISSYINGSYDKHKSDVTNLSGTFNREQSEVTYAMLDTLYRGDPLALADVVNRTKISTRNSGHNLNGNVSVYGSLKIPKTDDIISLRIGAEYSSDKNEAWRDYIVNYGSQAKPAIRQNQYFDNTPNRDASFYVGSSYTYAFSNDNSVAIEYEYDHRQATKDSYAYQLDRLGEEGLFGVLPEGYLNTLDSSLSYHSHTQENSHSIGLRFANWADNYSWYFNPEIKFLHRDFDYLRNGTNYRVCRQYYLFTLPQYQGSVSRYFDSYKFNDRELYRHYLRLGLKAEPTTPDPVKMIDMTDNTDPMNIWKGNNGLKTAYDFSADFNWYLNVPVGGYLLSNTLELIYGNTYNALVNGYTYDTATGVRVNRTYNLPHGNYVAKIHVFPRLQFGSKGQFSTFYRGGLDYIHSADMIGVDKAEPEKSTVETWWQAHTLDFSWQIGKQQIGFQGQVNSRHTTSTRKDFKSITATHTNLGLRGQFKLPKGFGISTDFTLYMRRGYGSSELDTTDPVWNARLTYAPPKSHWTFMLDGFDMLHQLSNVSYAVNAQGRTITYTNVLPRYVMLHVQYKINIQPKKKIINNSRSFTW